MRAWGRRCRQWGRGVSLRWCWGCACGNAFQRRCLPSPRLVLPDASCHMPRPGFLVGPQLLNFPLNGGSDVVVMPWSKSSLMRPVSNVVGSLSVYVLCAGGCSCFSFENTHKKTSLSPQCHHPTIAPPPPCFPLPVPCTPFPSRIGSLHWGLFRRCWACTIRFTHTPGGAPHTLPCCALQSSSTCT